VEPAADSVSRPELEAAIGSFTENFKFRIGVTPDIELVEVGELPRVQGKAKRIIRE
jgi:phenylacetate-coenzyme A ligase PaaK-like adenylate-forming protein